MLSSPTDGQEAPAQPAPSPHMNIPSSSNALHRDAEHSPSRRTGIDVHHQSSPNVFSSPTDGQEAPAQPAPSPHINIPSSSNVPHRGRLALNRPRNVRVIPVPDPSEISDEDDWFDFGSLHSRNRL